MPLDKSPLVVKEFKGLLLTDLDRGTLKYAQSEVPFEYSFDSQNLMYLKKGGMRTRDGIEKYVELLNIDGSPIQMWKIENLAGVSYTDRWLIATSLANGQMNLYDTGVQVPATNPILTLTSGVFYLTVINAFDRIYISPLGPTNAPKNRLEWEIVPGTFIRHGIFVYNGKYNARLAGAFAPVLGTFAAAAAAGGNVTPGLHLCSVLYETDTGFISNFANTTGTSVTTTGANATINFTNIPTGPTGTAKRHIIITKIVVNNDGQGFKSYEPFIAFTINDNTTTTGSFTKPDSALVDSAKDYLDSPKFLVPCVGFAVYGTRLVYIQLGHPWSTNVTDVLPKYFYTAFSPPNRPEQLFDFSPATEGEVPTSLSAKNIGPEYSGYGMAGAELNKVFYIFKEDSTFAVIANDELDPAEWEEPTLIDGGKGAFARAVAKIGNNSGNLSDGALLVAGKHGLTYFNGVFAQRSIVEGIVEQNIFLTELEFVKVFVDPVRQLIFLIVGDPVLTTANFIMVGNYYYGIDINTIRWTKFTFGEYPAGTNIIIADIDLRQPGTSGNVGPANKFNSLYSLFTILTRKLVSGTTYDAHILSEALIDKDFEVTTPATYPPWLYETGYTPNKDGAIYTFGPLKIRATVSGSLPFVVESAELDATGYNTIAISQLTSNPGKYYSFNMNKESEQIRLKLYGQNRVFLQTLILHIVEKYKERPRV